MCGPLACNDLPPTDDGDTQRRTELRSLTAALQATRVVRPAGSILMGLRVAPVVGCVTATPVLALER